MSLADPMGNSSSGDPPEPYQSPRWQTDEAGRLFMILPGNLRRTLDEFIAAFSDPKEGFGSIGASVIGHTGDPRVIAPLVARLADANVHVRRGASIALSGIIGHVDFSVLDPEHTIRRLPQSEQEHLLGVLLPLLNDADRVVRANAVQALGSLGDRRATELLIARLADPESYVREKAAWALGRIGDERAGLPLIAALADTDARVREWAIVSLGWLKDARAVEPLITLTQDATQPPTVREAAINSLSKIGDTRAVEPLLTMFQQVDDLNRRSQVAWALGELGDHSIVPALLRIMQDEHSPIRREAVWTLRHLRASEAADPLLALLAAEEVAPTQPYLLNSVMDALADIGDRRVFEPLLRHLQQGAGDQRYTAVWNLGKLDDPRAVEPLIAALADEDAIMRGEAANALWRIDDARVLDLLITALRDDPDPSVRYSAAEGLGWRGDRRAIPALEYARTHDQEMSETTGMFVQEAAARALQEIQRRATEF